MAEGKFVSYLRVSTDKQGRSGLVLEAQRDAVSRYLNGGRWKLVAEYDEVESGKRNSRPQLQAAIGHGKATGAKLVIARLDRLARNLHFVHPCRPKTAGNRRETTVPASGIGLEFCVICRIFYDS
jgi:DNA invertase Pin-like site-specific DNA recombinase